MSTFEEYMEAQRWDPKKMQPNQLYRDLMGVQGLCPWDGNNSSSRKQMFSSHIGQCLTTIGANTRTTITGVEREYGKYTFSVKMPHDGRIIRVIDRYPTSIDHNAIKSNPQKIAIYERADTKEVGFISIEGHCSHHQYFGFKYAPGPALSKLTRGAEIKEGEIFLDSPAVTPDGDYNFANGLNVALMSHPSTSEDGVMICRDVLEQLSFRTYEKRVIDYGSKRFARNLYGDRSTFKPHPEIGDWVREDGLLMALCEYNTLLGPVEQSVDDLMRVDYQFDRLTYASQGRGKVVDLRVINEPSGYSSALPEGMEEQPKRYDMARRRFYQTLLDEYSSLRRQRGNSLVITPEFSELLREAISVVGVNSLAPKDPIRKLYRQAPLDEWRIELTIEYLITPNIGFKLAGVGHGN